MSRKPCDNSPPDCARRAVAFSRHLFRPSFTCLTTQMAPVPFIDECRYKRSGVVSHSAPRTRPCALRRRNRRAPRRPFGRRPDRITNRRDATENMAQVGHPEAGPFAAELFGAGFRGSVERCHYDTRGLGSRRSGSPGVSPAPATPTDRPRGAPRPAGTPYDPRHSHRTAPRAAGHRSDRALSENRYTRGRSTGASACSIPDSGTRTIRQPSHRGQ